MPFQGNLFGIPMVSVIEDQHDTGLSLVLSPEDTLLDLNLRTSTSGELVFSREYHRISSAKTIRFAMDIVTHSPIWACIFRRLNRIPPNGQDMAADQDLWRNADDFLYYKLADVEQKNETLIIKRGAGKGTVVISLEEYNSIMETVHLLRSKANSDRLFESIRQMKEGEVVKKDLIDEQ
ncbi:MAG: type II toxin-antitoxin system Phd/YefM family antitoxin [Bacteroidales bacterium]